MIRFGPFQLDPAQGRLSRDDVSIPVQPKVFELIVFLSRHPGQLTTRDELLQGVWQDVFVSDDALTQTIRKARKALGDTSRPARYIETVPRRGYRFIAPPPTRRRDSASTRELVGREAEVDHIEQMLKRRAMVLVHGPGGIGKTALLRAIIREWPTESLTISLGEQSRWESLQTAVRQQLDGLGPVQPRSALGVALRLRGPCLLVIDAIQRLEPEAIEGIREWLQVAPKLRILAAAQSRLPLPEAYPIRLESLDAAHAYQLLATRCQALGVDLAEESPRDITGLIEELDAVPLALELLSSQLRIWSAAELLQRIREKGGEHDLIQNTLGLSWESLSGAEQGVLGHCALFEASFLTSDLLAITHRVGLLEAVGNLVDKNWLHWTRVGQSRRLHLHLRIRTWLRTHAPTEISVQKALIEHLLNRGEALLEHYNQGRPVDSAFFSLHRQDFQRHSASSDTATAIRVGLLIAGAALTQSGGVEWGWSALERVRPHLKDASHRVQVKWWHHRAQLARFSGKALEPIEAAFDRLIPECTDETVWEIWTGRSIIAHVRRDLDTLETCGNQLLASPSHAQQAEAYRMLSIVYDGRKQWEEEAEAIEKGLALAEEGPLRAALLSRRANSAKRQGHFSEAEQDLRQAIVFNEAAGRLHRAASARGNLANLLGWMERYPESKALFELTTQAFRTLGDVRNLATSQINRSLWQLHGDPAGALKTANEALGSATLSQVVGLIHQGHIRVAQAEWATGCPEDARARLTPLLVASGNTGITARLWYSAISASLGHNDAAEEAYASLSENPALIRECLALEVFLTRMRRQETAAPLAAATQGATPIRQEKPWVALLLCALKWPVVQKAKK